MSDADFQSVKPKSQRNSTNDRMVSMLVSGLAFMAMMQSYLWSEKLMARSWYGFSVLIWTLAVFFACWAFIRLSRKEAFGEGTYFLWDTHPRNPVRPVRRNVEIFYNASLLAFAFLLYSHEM